MILAIETVEQFGSVALFDGKLLIEEIQLPRDRRSAQTLAPTIDSLLRKYSVSPQQIDSVVVVVGPGSFTGLRVGVATAQLFAYSVGAKIVAVRTHEVCAIPFCSVSGINFISVGVDAQRGDVVVQNFRRSDKKSDTSFEATCSPHLVSVSDWWAESHNSLFFTGPAMEKWHSKSPDFVAIADSSLWCPSASAAGIAALSRLSQGISDDLWSLLPIYARPSAAEENAVKISQTTCSQSELLRGSDV
ncbi:MAG: tRNA (adenosine(37)-N6)-threonylcarbamoyltransferase complex dimerization subunit type 1 TsaB [Thermoguttaceae bacterium]